MFPATQYLVAEFASDFYYAQLHVFAFCPATVQLRLSQQLPGFLSAHHRGQMRFEEQQSLSRLQCEVSIRHHL